MAITANQAQGLVLALFGASAGGHLTSLSAASSVAGLAADLATSAGLILGKDLSSNTAFRDHVLSSSLKLTGAALTAAQTWMDGEFTKGTARGDILTAAVTYLDGLTDTSSVFYAAASSYRDTVKAAVTWSQGAGASTFGVSALRAQQGNTDVVAGNTFTLTTGVDGISGTAGNDTITGTSSTMQDTDAIVDGSTTDNDVLNMTLTATNNAATITNIETLNFDWNAYGTAGVALSAVSGAKQVNISSTKVGYLGDLTIADAGSNNINAGAGIVGTVTLTDSKSGVALTADNAAAVSVTTTRTSATGTVSSKSATTLTLTDFANGTINSGYTGASTVTVNADDNGKITGKTTINVAAPTVTIGTNTYAGDLTVNSTAATATITHTAGGIGNSLTIGGTGDVTLVTDSTADAETINNAKTAGSLTIKNSATTQTIDASNWSANTIWFNGIRTVADTVNTGANLKYSGSGTDVKVTIAGSGTTDTATATVTSQTVDEMTLSGVETLNWVAAATQRVGTDQTVATLTLGASTNKVVLSGTNDVVVTSIADAGTLDASALVGTLTVAGTSTTNNVTVKGGSGNATITGTQTSGNLTVTTLDGDDTITAVNTSGAATLVLGNGANTVTANSTLTGTLVVNAGTGIDTVSATGVTTGTVNLNLGDGDNVVTVGGTALTSGVVTLTTGAGADTFTVGSAAGPTAKVTISAGAGDDVIIVNGDGVGVGGRTWGAASKLVVDGGEGSDILILQSGTDLTGSTVTTTLSNIEIIRVTGNGDSAGGAGDNTNANFKASTLSGKTYTMQADGTADEGFTVTGSGTTTTVDLSTLTIDRSVEYAVSGTTITVSSAAQGVAITGTAVADTITGSAYADTIVAGKGIDSITPGTGNDSIDITEATAYQVRDTIIFGTAVAAACGVDTITGFKVGTDKLNFLNSDTTGNGAAGNATFVGTAAAIVAGASAVDISGDINTATDEFVELTTTLTSNGTLANAVDGSELLKALSSTTTAATGIKGDTTEKYFLAAYQNGDAYIYYVDSGANDTAVASEILLVGVLKGITAGSLASGDILLHA